MPRHFIEDFLEEIRRAHENGFINSPGSAPGLVLSALPNGHIYGSIVLYTQPLGQGKVVLVSERAISFQSMINSLREKFINVLETQIKSQDKDLEELLNKSLKLLKSGRE